MRWLNRLFRPRPQAIPDELWRHGIARLPFLERLPPGDDARLKALCETLLDRTPFSGAAGFALTDGIAVAIAAQACLPVLNLTLDLYADMAGVIVYPAQFVVPQSEVDAAGVVHEWREPVSGEAIDAGGAVVLSWEDAGGSATPGCSVVIHEFAHKIDMRNGPANGRPPFLAGLHDGLDAREWRQAFGAAYDSFCRRVDRVETQLPAGFDDADPDHAALYDTLAADLPLDPYAARHPAEFFAVASEAFFVLPGPLAGQYPEVYRLLARYYRQDPLLTGLAVQKTLQTHL